MSEQQSLISQSLSYSYNSEYLPLRSLKDIEESSGSKTSRQEEDGDGSNSHLSAKEAAYFQHAIITTCYTSIILLVILAIMFIGATIQTLSTTAMGLACDLLLDAGTSGLILWRFYGSSGTVYSSNREFIACIAMAVVFICLSIAVFIKAIIALIEQTLVEEVEFLVFAGVVTMVVCFGLTVTKYYLGKKLNSESVVTDAFGTAAETFIALGVVVSSIVYSKIPEIWYLDSVVALVVSVGLFAWGTRLLGDIFKSRNLAAKE